MTGAAEGAAGNVAEPVHPLVSPVALETVARIAREAGALIRDTYGAHGAVDFKGTVNPVTQTDKAAEALIFSGLEEAFPDPRILGEESGGDSALGSFTGTDPLWLVDPLDGTNNFAHGFPHFCVSIGLAARGAVQLGVIYDPMRDEIFTTMRGHGAHLDGQSIHVSDTAKLADAFLAAGFSYARRVVAENNARMLDVFLRRSQGVRRAGSAALDLAYVACGRFDAFWEPGLSPWDIAAGLLLVEEAGGRFSDFSGGDSRVFSEGELLASNGKIHDEMLRVLREGRGAPHPDFPSLSS